MHEDHYEHPHLSGTALMHKFRTHLWGIRGSPTLRDNTFAARDNILNPSVDSIIDSPSSQCPSLMNINNMMAVGVLLEYKMGSFLCSSHLGSTGVHAAAHAPVITTIPNNLTSLIRNLL